MSVLLVESKTADCTVVLKDGTEIDIESWELWRNNLHHFKGWTCAAGSDTIIIESDFQVWSGVCRNDNLGNLLDDNFSLLKEMTICTKNQCTTCTSDLNNSKKLIQE